ncbi:hypothetical protein N9B82_05985 [Saprospiraceae bacterium]|nr:hypothetical protein [Saprospiraceae bacterium]
MKKIEYKKWIRNIALLLLACLSYILFSAAIYETIPNKLSKNIIRIAYVNLNKSPISKEELLKYSKFDCDLWLFAEWNGNNLQNSSEFRNGYTTVFEKSHKGTYGFMVMAKSELELSAAEINLINKNYVCNYAKIGVNHERFHLAFLHAPPPVPSCKYETSAYISDALAHLKQKEGKNPQLIIGDLNLLSTSSSYKNLIQSGFRDIFETKSLFKGTFGGSKYIPKFLRIDYAFTNKKSTLPRSYRFKLSSSDHCGLLIDLDIQQVGQK